MHQSRKEQGLQRESRKLLHADFREAIILAGAENNVEVSDEPGARKPAGRGFSKP
ncbi:hypothetical protein [Paenibacillus protaetiae]|uniref:hypothetical protein n=1 Tax=Paenibacillus protaetiae TaxID=2509456 RepID=UPI0013EABCD8|nr:hypothetical protein [Paenibacillus protaetiae]